VIAIAIVIGNAYRIKNYDLLKCVCDYMQVRLCKGKPSSHHMSQSGRKVGKRSTKPPGFTIPYYFYIYNISLDNFAVIQTIGDEIYLFTMGTPYKINSRTPVFASSGEGFYYSNLPPPRRSGSWTLTSVTVCINGALSSDTRGRIQPYSPAAAGHLFEGWLQRHMQVPLSLISQDKESCCQEYCRGVVAQRRLK
jgi:hypothetical protein